MDFAWWLETIILPAIRALVLILVLLTGFAYLTWYERKLLARFQVRYGPNRAGPKGLLQPVADAFKAMFKEEIIPNHVDKPVYLLAPALALIPALVLRTVDQTPMSIGVLTLVPVLLALCWPALRLLELRYPERRRRWQWGWLHITGPLSGSTLLGMASLVLSELIGPNLAGATGGGGCPDGFALCRAGWAGSPARFG